MGLQFTFSTFRHNKAPKQKSKESIDDLNTPIASKFPKPSRKTLWRIRYYEFKIQMEDFWNRTLDVVDWATFHKLDILKNRTPIEEEPCQTDRSTNTENVSKDAKSSKPGICRYKRKKELVVEADDEESELEPGEVLQHSRRVKFKKGRDESKRRKTLFAQPISEDENEIKRPRKRRSSLTHKSMERNISNTSIKSMLSGDSKLSQSVLEADGVGDEKVKGDEIIADVIKDNTRTEVSSQTEPVQDEHTKTETNCQEEMKTDTLTAPNEFKRLKESGPRKTLMEHIKSLSNRKRARVPENLDVNFGFKMVAVRVGPPPGRQKKKDSGNFDGILPHNSRNFNKPFKASKMPVSEERFFDLHNSINNSKPAKTVNGNEVSGRLTDLGSYRPLPLNQPVLPEVTYKADSLIKSTTVIPSGTKPILSSLNIAKPDKVQTSSFLEGVLKNTNPINSKSQGSPMAAVFPSSLVPDQPGICRFPDGNKASDIAIKQNAEAEKENQVYVPKTQFTAKFYRLLNS